MRNFALGINVNYYNLEILKYMLIELSKMLYKIGYTTFMFDNRYMEIENTPYGVYQTFDGYLIVCDGDYNTEFKCVNETYNFIIRK